MPDGQPGTVVVEEDLLAVVLLGADRVAAEWLALAVESVSADQDSVLVRVTITAEACTSWGLAQVSCILRFVDRPLL